MGPARLCMLVPALLLCAGASPSTATRADLQPEVPSTAQLIAARQAGMHMAATLLYTSIRNGVESGVEVSKIAHEPEGIALWANAIPGLFPADSVSADSRARMEIWSNKADFDRKAGDLKREADRLAQLAHANDKAASLHRCRP